MRGREIYNRSRNPQEFLGEDSPQSHLTPAVPQLQLLLLPGLAQLPGSAAKPIELPEPLMKMGVPCRQALLSSC